MQNYLSILFAVLIGNPKLKSYIDQHLQPLTYFSYPMTSNTLKVLFPQCQERGLVSLRPASSKELLQPGLPGARALVGP